MSPIADLETYNDHMRAGLKDKLFFLDKIGEVDTFVDFGCGDGSLLAAVKEARRSASTIGIDCDAGQRHLAAGAGLDQVWTLPAFDWPTFSLHGECCLILSSVMHEVMTQGATPGFFSMLAFPWKYICFRDFALSRVTPAWAQHEALIKGRWANDPREQEETYFHFSAEEVLSAGMQQDGYSVIHFDHHSHPPTRAYVESAHGIKFPARTHYTMLLERK